MLTLCIDTSCNTAGVALCENEIVLGEISINDKNTHSVKLMPAIEYLYKMSGRNVNDTDLIAVVNGPGSYTGLRIGVSTAKAVAYAIDVPVVGVNTLDMLAYSYVSAGVENICSVIDARNTHMYFAVYSTGIENSKRYVKRITDYAAMPAEEMYSSLKEKIHGKIMFTGDGVIANGILLNNLFGDDYCQSPDCQSLGRVSFAAEVAGEIFNEAENKEIFSADNLNVFYLRTPRISVPKKNI